MVAILDQSPPQPKRPRPNLCLHCGATKVECKDVQVVPTPRATATWTPIPHLELVSQVERTLKANGLNKPCLLAIKDANLLAFVETPNTATTAFFKPESEGGLLWMPYRGTDATNQTVAGNRETSSSQTTYWNSTRAVTVNNTAVNAEYGMVAEGQGTYFYLNNSKADDQVYLQSTHANIYLGLNN